MKIRRVKDLLKQLQDYDPEMEIYTYTDVHCEFQYIAPSDPGYKVDEFNIHRCFENVPCSTYNKKVLVVG